MVRSKKLEWIKQNGGPYPVLWLKVSRVADYYYYYYNHWVPRGDTGYLDADFKLPPNQRWSEYEKVLRDTLAEANFQFCSDEMAASRTSLVKDNDYDSIPEDDPQWADDAFEPPLVDISIHQCLFADS